jgi:hypothetical protein
MVAMDAESGLIGGQKQATGVVEVALSAPASP